MKKSQFPKYATITQVDSSGVVRTQNVAPCLSHPCDSPNRNPCRSTCAFARNNLASSITNPKVVIPAEDYSCSMGGQIVTDGEKFFLHVGEKMYPEQQSDHKEVQAAQRRLYSYLGV